jgi:hypothetical protein
VLWELKAVSGGNNCIMPIAALGFDHKGTELYKEKVG